jgi:hypothetical protein
MKIVNLIFHPPFSPSVSPATLSETSNENVVLEMALKRSPSAAHGNRVHP